MKSYNIGFPFNDDVDINTYFKMCKATKEALSSNLLVLLLTQKGERYYQPDYGTNLLKFIFDPNDDINASDVIAEIKRTVSLYIPSLTINDIIFNWKTDNNNEPISENQLSVKIKFTFNEDAFSEQSSLELTF